MHRSVIVATFGVCGLAHADSLTLIGQQSLWKGEGMDLRIDDGVISMTATAYETGPTPEHIMRSSLDTSYWYWEVVYDGALAEGWGDCVLRSSVPNAVLVCDD